MATNIIETYQHHFLTGMTRAEAVQYFADAKAAFLASVEPGTTLYGADRPDYYEKTVTERDRCPWGYTWFAEGQDGTLELFRANWDSSG